MCHPLQSDDGAMLDRRTKSYLQKRALLSLKERQGSHASIDQFFEKEAIMWGMLKSTFYWKALKSYLTTATPIPAACFLRMQLQSPHDMTLEELGRVFLEQDSVALMTMVSLPFYTVPRCILCCFGKQTLSKSRPKACLTGTLRVVDTLSSTRVVVLARSSITVLKSCGNSSKLCSTEVVMA